MLVFVFWLQAEGSLRVDANVSVRPKGSSTFGPLNNVLSICARKRKREKRERKREKERGRKGEWKRERERERERAWRGGFGPLSFWCTEVLRSTKRLSSLWTSLSVVLTFSFTGHPGTRCEVKNISGVRFLNKAIDYEAKRHIETLKYVQAETNTFAI